MNKPQGRQSRWVRAGRRSLTVIWGTPPIPPRLILGLWGVRLGRACPVGSPFAGCFRAWAQVISMPA